MNELTLDGKLYISSRRAAEITGYAKDYVGQLCREGRVEARLVGRNWYVLKDAIQGKQFAYASEDKAISPSGIADISPRQDSQIARYVTQDQPDFPMVVRRIVKEPTQDESTSYDDSLISPPQAPPATVITSPIEPETAPEEPQEEEKPAEEINLRRIREYEPIQVAPESISKEDLPREMAPRPQGRSRSNGIWLYTGVQVACALVVLCAIALAGIGSGFYQSPILKPQADILSGISFYTKQ